MDCCRSIATLLRGQQLLRLQGHDEEMELTPEKLEQMAALCGT